MNAKLRVWGGVLVTAVALACASCGSGATAATGQVPARPVADVQVHQPTATQAAAVTRFGENLFIQMLGGDPNPVISPLSVFIALGMAYDGAKGDTAQAFQDVLGMSAADARASAAYLLTKLNSEQAGTTVSTVNSAWLDDSMHPAQDWVDRLAAYYQAQVFNTDLQGSGAVKDVNNWISDATKGLIPKMLDKIDPDAAALLVNALYLKAAWAEEFDTNDTHQQSFDRADGSQVQAWFVSAPLETRRYIHTADAEGVVLPYKDGRLAFMAVMPTSGDLALSGGDLTRWLGAAVDRDNVGVTMPKFHTEYGADLGDALKALGLGVAFDGRADFTGMGTSDKGPLCISRVLQKVSMDVGEKGTEAAAATVVEMVPSSGHIALGDPVYLVFDHPYIYSIIDQVTGVPLFIGAMEDPSLAPPTVE